MSTSRSEASIERACCAHAKSEGLWPIKLATGDTGMPDRGFLIPNGRIWLCEFKTEKGRLSKRQLLVFNDLRLAGHEVSVIRSVEMFKTLLRTVIL